MKPTTQELALLRTRPQRSELKLWIYRPQTMMAALVNDAAIARNATTIAFDTVSSGVYTNVQPGQTMYVGTAAGKADIGRVRVKSITFTEIVVARNSLTWADNLFLTVVDFYEIWPMFIRETQQGVDTTHYKDYDIPYTNQNAVMGTLMSIGPHVVVNQGDQVYWSVSGTVQTENLPITWSWTFGGGSVPTGTTDPIPVTYNTPGYYTTEATASLPSGTYDKTYRHVIVAGGAVQPYLQFGFDSLDGTRDEGGWVAKIWMREDVTPEIFEGSLVIITSEDWYGSTKQSIGGNGVNRQKTLFVGYVIDNSINYDYINSLTEFHVVSPTGRMKLMDNSSMEIDSVVNPVNWYQIPNLNGKKMMYHYLKWHSTALNCCDARWLASDVNMYSVQGEVSNLYDICANLMKKYLVGEMVSDRQGTLWFERHPMGVHEATGTYNTIIGIDRQDWMNEIAFDESFLNQTSYLEMGGLVYSGPVTGTWQDVLSGAPGDNLKGSFGKSELIQGHYVVSQGENNQLSGDVLAYKNTLFPAVNIDLAGWYSIFDIAPQEILNLTLNRLDTHRGLTWDQKAFLIRDMSIDHKASTHALLPKITVHEVTQGLQGDTVPIVVPPVTTLPGFGPLPPFDPGWNPFPIPTPTPNIMCKWWLHDPNSQGPFPVYWDKQIVTPGETAIAFFPCTIRPADAYTGNSKLEIDALVEGDTSNISVQAFSQNINPSSLDISPNVWHPGRTLITATFAPQTATRVAGFKLSVSGGAGGQIPDGYYLQDLGIYSFSVDSPDQHDLTWNVNLHLGNVGDRVVAFRTIYTWTYSWYKDNDAFLRGDVYTPNNEWHALSESSNPKAYAPSPFYGVSGAMPNGGWNNVDAGYVSYPYKIPDMLGPVSSYVNDINHTYFSYSAGGDPGIVTQLRLTYYGLTATGTMHVYALIKGENTSKVTIYDTTVRNLCGVG